MKLGKFFFAATAAIALVACTNDEPVNNGPEVNTNPSDGYIAVAINLPTQPSSRGLNDVFDDGRLGEYDVTSGALLLFTDGASGKEADAVFHSAYIIDGFTKVGGGTTTDNLTVSYLKTVKVNDIPATGDLYGLVLLNYENIGAVDGTSFTLKDTGAAVATFSTLTNTPSVKAFYNGKGNDATHFFMTNAPLSTQKGGTQNTKAPSIDDVFTLIKLTNSIQKTEAAAKEEPAGTFFVERAVAKATLDFMPNAFQALDKDGNPYDLAVKVNQWCVSNTEPSSFIVRNMGTGDYMGYRAANNFRMAGSLPIGTTDIQEEVDLYRTYFCIDPQFNAPATLDQTMNFTGADQAEYCYENTFDVTNMTRANTTVAVIEVTFGDGKTPLYTLNDDRETVYTSIEDAESSAKAFVCNSIIVNEAIASVLPPNSNKQYTGDEIDEFLTIDWTRDEETGLLSVAAVTISKFGDMTGSTTVDEAGIALLNAQMGNAFRITEYSNGVSYYPVLIQHFGDDLTPWEVETPNTPTTHESYEEQSALYLGRYGMVRNNWYELSVNSILKIGSPVIPNINVETPDDENKEEKWLAFKINVLAWAKRTQNVQLGK